MIKGITNNRDYERILALIYKTDALSKFGDERKVAKVFVYVLATLESRTSNSLASKKYNIVVERSLLGIDGFVQRSIDIDEPQTITERGFTATIQPYKVLEAIYDAAIILEEKRLNAQQLLNKDSARISNFIGVNVDTAITLISQYGSEEAINAIKLIVNDRQEE